MGRPYTIGGAPGELTHLLELPLLDLLHEDRDDLGQIALLELLQESPLTRPAEELRAPQLEVGLVDIACEGDCRGELGRVELLYKVGHVLAVAAVDVLVGDACRV